jgi:hypothetical protein
VSEVAVIVVAHDSASSLPATLASVAGQLSAGDELIVVDNASRDASAAVARACSGARVIERRVNDGFGGGCHAGVAVTTAALLFFLNPDAVLEEGCLSELRGMAASHPGWGAWQALVLLDEDYVNTDGGVTHWSGIAWAGRCGTRHEDVPRQPHEVSFASGAALMVRREAWDAVGGFEARYFMYAEDVDFSMRLRLAGWGVGAAPAARVRHRYDFEKGDYKWFHLERNRWWTVLGAYPTWLLIAVLPALLGLELVLLLVSARDGWLRAKLRAQAAVIRSLPWALRRRQRIQAARTIGPRDFVPALSASLDSPFLGGIGEVTPVRVLQERYWSMAARVAGAGRG